MSCNWKTLPLGEILELVIDHRGKTPKKLGFKDFQTEGYPVLSAKHVKTSGLVNLDSIRYANLEMYKKWMKVPVQEGDVVLTSEAPMGETFFIDGSIDYVLGQRLFGLRPKKELIEPRYLMAWLSSEVGQNKLKQRASGSTVQGIKQAELLKIEIDVPPLRTQKIIANNEAYISKKINLNKKLNQTLEQIAQAIFKSWFVDFEPVKAKISALAAGGSEEDALFAAMQAISDKDKAQLTQLQTDNPEHYNQLRTTAKLFPSAMQDSELGEIPEGWSCLPASEIYEITIGKTPPRKEPKWFTKNPKAIKWLSIRKMANNASFVSDTDEYLTDDAIVNHRIKICPAGTVFLSFKLTVGRVAIAQKPMATNEAIAHFRISDDSPGSYWTYLKLKSYDFTSLGSTSSIATAINSKMIKAMILTIPNKDLSDRFENLVAPLLDEVSNNLSNNESLTSVRDTLLPKLLTGEVKANETT